MKRKIEDYIKEDKFKSALACYQENASGKTDYELCVLIYSIHEALGDEELKIYYNKMAGELAPSTTKDYHRAVDHYLNGRWGKLDQEFSETFEPAGIQLLVGKANLELNNPPRASVSFETYYRRTRNERALFMNGRALFKSGKYEKAIKYFNDFIERTTEPILRKDGFLFRGLCYSDLGHDDPMYFQKALHDFERGLALDPTNINLLWASIQIYRWQEDWENIISFSTTLIHINPDFNDSFMFSGLRDTLLVEQEAITTNVVRESLEETKKSQRNGIVSFQRPPRNIDDVLRLRGAARLKLGYPREAILDFEATNGYKLQSNPEPFLDKAAVLYSLKEFGAASKILFSILQWPNLTNREVGMGCYNLALIFSELRYHKLSVDANLRAIENLTGIPKENAQVNLAAALSNLGDNLYDITLNKSKAKDIYAKLPNHPIALSNLGILLFDEGEKDEAWSLINKSVDLTGQNFYPLKVRANLLKSERRWEEAKRDYQAIGFNDWVDECDWNIDSKLAFENEGLLEEKLKFDLELESILKSQRLTEPKDLIHYTKLPVAKTLVENHSFLSSQTFLRAYGTHTMNDPEEGKAFLKNIDAFISNGGPTSLMDEFEDYKKYSGYRGFVVSFLETDQMTDHSDNLLLWRLYGRDFNGTEGGGCSLLFRPEISATRFNPNYSRPLVSNPSNPSIDKLPQTMEIKPEKGEFFRVIYLNQEGQKRLTPLISIVDKILNPNGKKIPQKLKEYVFKEILKVSHLIKSNEFNYEKEIRLVWNGGKGQFGPLLKVDDSFLASNDPRAYVEDMFPVVPFLNRIIVGPKANRASDWKDFFELHEKRIRNEENEVLKNIDFLNSSSSLVDPFFEVQNSKIPF